jgi:hypothetical protein
MQARKRLSFEQFPEVSGIVIRMTYYQRAAIPILMVRNVDFWPSRHAYFKMDCMVKGCIDSGFDLTSVISSMIKIHKKFEKEIFSAMEPSMTLPLTMQVFLIKLL